jgi:hypothetical protein
MQPLPLSNDGQTLANNLRQAASVDLARSSDEKTHIAGVAAGLYVAYERLRNAAEYTEQHLLLRAAIERFLRRTILFNGSMANVGHELVVELTESGYLHNDTVAIGTVKLIDNFIAQYVNLGRAIESAQHVPHDKARKWTIQVLSVSIEKLLAPHHIIDAFIDFTFKHYLSSIDKTQFAAASDEQFSDALFIAVHRALFKSDIASVRFAVLVRRQNAQAEPTGQFVAVCKAVDTLFQGPLTNKLARLVSRNGAPLRILREVILTDAAPVETLANRPNLLNKIRAVAEYQYQVAHSRLVKGIVRAIIFIVITKVLIGVSAEVPYDLITVGSVAALPLAINLLFPALYMATASWSIKKPGPENTEAIVQQVDRVLYQTDKPPLLYRVHRRVASIGLHTVFNAVYALTFLISFGVAVYVLTRLHFTIVQSAVFFVFFSAVSFLRFRLIQSAHELDFVDHKQSLLAAIADFFYTPFVRLGMWLSDKYKKVNVITILLDFAIELPLKSSLRLLREWVGFMRDKREEI